MSSCCRRAPSSESELDALEALLGRHGVIYLQAGVRERSARSRGGVPAQPDAHRPVSAGEQWVHIRQDKHHRWSLDERQIYQYHLGGALHPHIRWWEAIDVPRRSVQVVEVGEGITIVSLVCEDLAQNDDVAELIRSIGPTIVSTALLDGPQLTSRWSARYASVLADDPGSAVMTLTSFGMAQRSRPPGHDASPVIALWKDPARGTREISLEPGAQGVLLTGGAELARPGGVPTAAGPSSPGPTTSMSPSTRSGPRVLARCSPDARTRWSSQAAPSQAVLEADPELTILTSWAEAMADALVFAPRAWRLCQPLRTQAPPGGPGSGSPHHPRR